MTTTGANGKLVSAAAILGAASLVSRLVGLLRERVFTTVFGAGDTFDAFVAAFRVPDLVFNLVVIGALSAAFIPLFTSRLVSASERSAGWQFANSIFNIMIFSVSALMLIYIVLAPVLVPLMTPGFSGEKLALTVQLSQIMALQPVLLAVSFVFSGILNSFKRFVAYATAPILYNVGIIFGVLVLEPQIGVAGLGWGVVLGALLHMGVQLPSVISAGWRWQPVVAWRSQDVRALGQLAIPRVVGLAAQQINLLVVTIIGSTLAAGSIAVFHLANNLQHLPIGMFGIAFAQAAFPTLSEQVARKQMAAFRNTLTRAFRYILFFVVPVSVIFLVLRAQLVRVLFGAGAFDWEDTVLTLETFGWLVVSVFAQATVPLLARAFYAQHDTKTPVAISVVSMLLNIGLAVVLAPRMGVQGLAVAFSLSAIVNVALLLAFLHWRLEGFNDREVLEGLARIAAAAILAGVVVQILKYPVAAVVDMTRFWGVFIQLVVAGSGGAAIYLGLCWLFGCDELVALRKYVPGRFKLKQLAGTETPRFEEGVAD